MEHYYETYIPEEDSLKIKLYYLANKMDPSDSEVNYAEIDGVYAYPVVNDGLWVPPQSSAYPEYEQEFMYHYLKSVTLEIHTIDLPIQQGTDDVWSFDEIQVTFNDGQTVAADIGKVIVYGKDTPPTVVNQISGSTSNYHAHDAYMKILQPLTIEKIALPFEDHVSHNIFLKLGFPKDIMNSLNFDSNLSVLPDWYDDKLDMNTGEENAVALHENLLPIHLNKDDSLKLFTRLNPDHRTYFYFNIVIQGITDSGELFVHKLPIIDMPTFNEKTINKIILEKQGGLNR